MLLVLMYSSLQSAVLHGPILILISREDQETLMANPIIFPQNPSKKEADGDRKVLPEKRQVGRRD